MKYCTRCLDQKPLESFQFIKGRYYGSWCKQCILDHRKEPGVKEHFREWRIQNVEKKKAVVRDLKKSPCLDCKNTFPPCAMEFDHVRGTKSYEVSTLMSGNFSMKKLLDEIAKCELVCSNCHAIRTDARRNLSKEGT